MLHIFRNFFLKIPILWNKWTRLRLPTPIVIPQHVYIVYHLLGELKTYIIWSQSSHRLSYAAKLLGAPSHKDYLQYSQRANISNANCSLAAACPHISVVSVPFRQPTPCLSEGETASKVHCHFVFYWMINANACYVVWQNKYGCVSIVSARKAESRPYPS